MDLEGAAGALTGADEETARPVSADAAQVAVDAYPGGTRRNPAQHHRRARARPARRYPRRQGRAFNKIPTKGDKCQTRHESAKARYAAADRIGVLEELLQERYSVRAFLRARPRETIEHVLTVAQRTASWCNSQPCRCDRKRRGQGAVSQGDLAEAPQAQGRP